MILMGEVEPMRLLGGCFGFGGMYLSEVSLW